MYFYRAMLCIRGTSHGPMSVCLSVCLSVTSRCSTTTAKRRLTQTTPHDSPGTLVFWCQRSPRNSTGVTPYGGAECRWGESNRRLSTNNGYISTRSSAIAEGPRDASCQLKSCQLQRNSAETTYTTSPDRIDGMKLEI